MDLIFGDTAAHEEKKRIKHIEAELRGTPIEEEDLIKPVDAHVEQAWMSTCNAKNLRRKHQHQAYIIN